MALHRCSEVPGSMRIPTYYHTRSISVLLIPKDLTIFSSGKSSDSFNVFTDSMLRDASRRLRFVNWYLYGAKTTRDRDLLSDAHSILRFTLTRVMGNSRL